MTGNHWFDARAVCRLTWYPDRGAGPSIIYAGVHGITADAAGYCAEGRPDSHISEAV